MWLLLSFAATTVLAILAYAQARNFVTRRLRYVDAVQSRIAPFVAGLATAAIAVPLCALLPIVGLGTAISVGLAVGTGVAVGARDVKRQLTGY